MKRVFYIATFFLICSTKVLWSQSDNVWSLSTGQLSLADLNLSNQQYQGPAFTLHANHEVFYRRSQQRISWNIYDSWQYGRLINVSHSALISYFGAHIGFGSHYNWRPIIGLSLKAGALIDLHGAVKFQSRNVNNIASADVQANILAALSAQYRWIWSKWGLALKYEVSTPLLGVMFVPELGQSYYEIYKHFDECIGDITHFSSFHNRQGVNGNFSVQFILPHITLHCALLHDNQWWHANNLKFYSHNIAGQIGFSLRLQTLSQIKN